MGKWLQASAIASAASLGAVASTGSAQAQIVHNQNVTIYNALCVGFDCATSESYGADSIRLKENNNRIHFDDTSTAGSFPSNDWRIEANSNANGGASYFAILDSTAGTIPFRVDAGAGSNALVVEQGGNVGFGTLNPVLELHVSDGDTPALRLEQNASSGFAAQTWDVAGNETNFFVRDATNGSTLPFRIRPGAPSSSIHIAAGGDVGVGTSSPASELHIQRANNGPTLTMASTGSPNRTWEFVLRDGDGEFAFNDPATTGADFIFTAGPTGGLEVQGDVTCNGTVSCFNDNSDIRYKSGVKTIENASQIVAELRPITWVAENGRVGTGLGAQEVAEVMKRNGFENWAGHTYKAKLDQHYLGYSSLIGILVAAQQEKDETIRHLEDRLLALSREINSLEEKVAR